MRCGLLALGLAVGAAACGSVKEPGTPGTDATVVEEGDFALVAPSTLTLPIAGSETVDIMVTRGDGIGAITLAIDAPANLTATLAEATLAEGSDSTALTISALGGMAAATGDITITATSGAITHTATISVTTTTITVSGSVRGGRSGVTVVLVGKPAVTSGANGAFSFTDVTPPYDLYAIGTEGSLSPLPSVHYYDDLTRPDPTITAPLASGVLNAPRSGSISGKRLGSGNTTSPGVVVWSGGGSAPISNGSFSLNLRWSGTASTSGQLHGLQFTTKPSGAPDTYLGYGVSPTTEVANGASVGLDVTLAAVASTAPITGSITPPANCPPTVTINQEFGDAAGTLWSTTSTSIDANIPILSGLAANVLLVCSNNSGSASYVHPVTAATTISATIPAPPTQTAPADAATGVSTSTPITWSGPTGPIYRVLFRGSNARYYVYTTKLSTTLPSIPEQPVPAQGEFSWAVQGFGPHASIDDAAGATDLQLVSQTTFNGEPHYSTSSGSRSFTAP